LLKYLSLFGVFAFVGLGFPAISLAEITPPAVSCPAQLAAPKRVAIVAAVSSGAYIAPRFKLHGIDSVHVMPKEGLPKGYALKEKDFVHVIPYSDDFNAMVAELKAQNIHAVIAGSEMGVELADKLSEALGLRTNGTRLSQARRNKFTMQETIKGFKTKNYPNGVPGIRQRLVRTIEEFRAWHKEENEGNFPVVIKPYQSAGTDGLFICENEEQVEKALKELIGKMSFLGTQNDALLAQEYLNNGTEEKDGKRVVIPGTEYVVDGISLDGKFIVTDVWRYHKTLIRRPEGGLSNIYDYDELMDFDDELTKQLIAYAEDVLNALEIKNGPSHMEIMMTHRGPVLVEVGARLIGGGSHLAVEAGTGVNPIEVFYEAYFDQEAFLKRFNGPRAKRTKHTWVPQMIVPVAGKVIAAHLEILRALPSAIKVDVHAEVGEVLPKTVDLLTSPGQAIFSHESLDQVKADHAKLRKAELNGELFELEKTP